MEKHNDEISMKDMMEEIEKSMKKLREGEMVKGKVISVTNDEVLVKSAETEKSETLPPTYPMTLLHQLFF